MSCERAYDTTGSSITESEGLVDRLRHCVGCCLNYYQKRNAYWNLRCAINPNEMLISGLSRRYGIILPSI
jgi:hypothetical protein